MTDVAFPYRVDARGRTAGAALDAHVRDMIEQVLFTAPGERVNRPTFGSGALQLVFAPNSDALAAAAQFTLQGALQQWLGDAIRAEGVEVRADQEVLRITVQYVVLRTQERRAAVLERQVGA
ncbi:MAG TPA: GPW/gp25 family protein [Longimicrobium sp.]|nr:GPW/gp25 family protein [Longimicrobium sp.]